MEQVKQQWGKMILMLAVQFPTWVIDRLEKRSEGMGFAVKVIPIVIILLSFASIFNLVSRAEQHRPGFSSVLTGTGIAILVPLAVLATMLVEGKWSYAFWVMAVVFAAVSGSIQYVVYRTDNTWYSILEAISFGYGVPFSEVMLAVMESRLYVQALNRLELKAQEKEKLDRQERQVVVLAAEAKAKKEQEEEEINRQQAQRILLDNLQEQKQVAMLDAYKRNLDLSLQLRKAKALAKLGFDSRDSLIRESSESNGRHDSLIHESRESNGKHESLIHESRESNGKHESLIPESEELLVAYYREHGVGTQRNAALALGVSQATIARWNRQLIKNRKLQKVGNGSLELIR